MDPIMRGKALRASRLMEEVAGAAVPPKEQLAEAAREIHLLKALGLKGEELRAAMEAHDNPMLNKAAVPADTLGSGDFGEGVLNAAWLTTTLELNLLDALVDQGSVPLLPGVRAAIYGTGWTADSVGEGLPKAIRQSGLDIEQFAPQKVATITVATKELHDYEQFRQHMDAEHRLGLARGTNRAVLDTLVDSSTATTATLEDALATAGPATGFVVAMPAGDVAVMALQAAKSGNTAFGVRGGLLAPGLRIVAVDDLDDTVVIPASRLAVRDFGMRVQTAVHASIAMADDPQSPAELVSMFQTNSAAILSERAFILGGDFSGVVVVSGS
ncbi:hypothetical protein GCM10007160_16790 [Litchfieldella qijiaojingensis]|uniref:Phage major capsid protein n=1 Tax=Litchfieldella qijiaojingensis TaxID=980347 RepID=A0ABQ2YPX6_9GAMM|nr:hypothetical protein [Halomonas qijiaojingensis]GGX89997.1 hypothetical protein GCM10007160_16790 [Halomonas qijiaojingensis]